MAASAPTEGRRRVEEDPPLSGRSRQQFPAALGNVPRLGMQVDRDTFVEKLQEIHDQARLVLDEMISAPSIHRSRLLHIITLVQQLEQLLAESA